MKSIYGLTAAAAVLGLTSMAMAEKPRLMRATGPMKVVAPKRIAKINRQGELLSPWVEYVHSDERPAGTDLIFDCYDPDDTGNPEDEDGCNAQFGYPDTSRWYFDPTVYTAPFAANDMTAEPNAGFIDGVQFAWNWPVTGPCVIVVFSGPEFDENCTADFGDVPDGVALDFGDLDAGDGYYGTVIIDLEGGGFSIPTGASYIMGITSDGVTPVDNVGTQFMQWGTSGPRPGEQGPIQYHDDTTIDGAFDVAECYDFTLGICPDPLGAMFAAYGTGEQPGDFDLTVGGSCPGTVTVSWSGAPANRTLALAKAECTGNFTIPNGPCAGTQLGLCGNGLQQVASFPSGNGSGQRAGNAPSSVCGDFLQLVAVPGCLTSNVDQIN